MQLLTLESALFSLFFSAVQPEPSAAGLISDQVFLQMLSG